MFKELLRIWQGESLLSKMTKNFRKMLRNGRWMFEEVTDSWITGQDITEIRDELYDRDHEINLAQQKVRRRIVNHLAVNPSGDLAACLILMSVVKDAERIGDYCKNMYEVIEHIRPEEGESEAFVVLQRMRDEILESYHAVIHAFVRSDEEAARSVIERNGPLAKECDGWVEKYLKGEEGGVNAVAYSLLFRYFKRVSGHLTNIATSVVAPVDQIDYYDEDPDPSRKPSS